MSYTYNGVVYTQKSQEDEIEVDIISYKKCRNCKGTAKQNSSWCESTFGGKHEYDIIRFPSRRE